jgi:hypothetical protein
VRPDKPSVGRAFILAQGFGLAALVAASACDASVSAPEKPVGCLSDLDCGPDALCEAGRCFPPLVIADEPPTEPAEPGDPPPSEPPPSEPPPAEPPPAEPPPVQPPPGAQRLVLTAGPELVDALPGCGCAAPAPAANVDLSARATAGGVCAKPADATCGIDGPNCRCTGAGLGTAAWGSGRSEEPRQPGEVWIVDEQVVLDGADSTLTMRVRLADDCLLSPGSTTLSANFGCCLLDCEGQIGDGQACYDYSAGGLNCSTFCDQRARNATSQDCLARGPVPVRITVEADGAGGFARQFCATMNDEQTLDAVELSRVNDRYTITSVAAGVREVAFGSSCS